MSPDGGPGGIDEPVVLAAWDPAWPGLAAAEIARLRTALGADCRGLEHIGSTSVPELLAKPVLDLMLGLAEPSAEIAARLAALGYHGHGEAGVPGRDYYTRRDGPAFNLHAVAFGGALWRDNLRLREHLRADPEARAAYRAAKEAALRQGAATLLAFSAAKAPALAALLAVARRAGD